MGPGSVILTNLQALLGNDIAAERFVDIAADNEAVRSLTADDAIQIAKLLGQSTDEAAVIAAHILVLTTEKLAELQGNYNCKTAAIINEAVERVFIREDLQQQVAQCRLFNIHFEVAQGSFQEALDSSLHLPETFRIAGETYALACTLLLQAECRLHLRQDEAEAARELSEAEALFEQHEDDTQSHCCQELRVRYGL